MKKNGDVFFVWLVSLIAFAVLMGSITGPHLLEEKALSDSFQSTEGEITSTDLKNHNSCFYKFSKGGQTYNSGGDSCGERNVGDKVAVFYATDNPSKSDNRNPKEAFREDFLTMFGPLIIMPLIIMLFYMRWRNRRR